VPQQVVDETRMIATIVDLETCGTKNPPVFDALMAR
jgi:hypothetical protein